MTPRTGSSPQRVLASAERNESTLAWPRLALHLAKAGKAFDADFVPERFSSGFGNLNYLIRMDGAPAVLRRPPFGPIPPGANDMAREFRVISGLNRSFPLAPGALHFCDDSQVLGAPFFIMEYRPGIVIGSDVPEQVTNNWQQGEAIGAVLSRHMVKILVDLHSIEPASVNLDTLGRPDGFVGRTVAGWRKRAALVWAGESPPALTKILDWLESHAPADTQPTLIHNDFKLDNLILDPATLSPVAVIDWDMGTRGAPLYDLAVLLSYWTEQSDPAVMHALRQMPSAGHGFATREQVVGEYARLANTTLHDFVFFRVLATLRIAVVFKQLHQRLLTGGTQDDRFTRFGDLADELLVFGLDVARERYL